MGFREIILNVIRRDSDRFYVDARDGDKLAGRTIMHNNNGVWEERVDVNRRYWGKGLATAMLQLADRVVRRDHPGDLRRFNDTNGYGYKGYTDGIPDDQIIDYDDSGLTFKP